MKVLITGGAGYIGSVATEIMVREGHQVTVFDNLQQGHREAVSDGADLIVGDLAEPRAVERALDTCKPDAVMHFAANSLVGESSRLPFKYIGDNVSNSLNLIRAMDGFGVRRIIFSSTANLYSRPRKLPIEEDDEVCPGSPYGESKAIIEQCLKWLGLTRGWQYTCLRYFNAAGATKLHGEDHSPETHLIPLVLQVAAGRRPHVEIYGDDYETPDGTCVRDYVHVEDLIDAHIKALKLTDVSAVVYNVGIGQGFSVREVIRAAETVTGRQIPVIVGRRRSGDVPILVASGEKIRNDLGWHPQYDSIERIIQSAWLWHQKNPTGYPRQ